MKQSALALKSHRVTVRMIGPMLANLRRLVGKDRLIGEEIRNAIRLYLDDKGQITGSRRYFTGVFRDEVRLLRRELSWHLTLITLLLAEMLSILIRNTLDLDEQSAKSFTPSGILKIAEERLEGQDVHRGSGQGTGCNFPVSRCSRPMGIPSRWSGIPSSAILS